VRNQGIFILLFALFFPLWSFRELFPHDELNDASTLITVIVINIRSKWIRFFGVEGLK